ncbi:MAG TPA: cupredoxin domain-containing protein [Chloroflexota bacterium]|nr:cupredoxin domain-containing protein [Chloroflexota bacterium]
MAQQARKNTNLLMVIAVIAIAALAVILVLLFGTQQRATTVEDSLVQSAPVVLYQDRIDPPVIEAIEGRPVQLFVTAAEGSHTIEIQPLVQPQQVPENQAVTINLTAPTAGRYPIIVEGPSGRIEGTLIILEVTGQAPPPREPAGGPTGQ